MPVYISYHSLDYDFAYKTLIFVRNLGFDANLCAPKDNLQQIVTRYDALIAILRPEYLQSPAYKGLIDLLDGISAFFPVLRAPISIDQWPSNMVFQPVADFSNRDLLSNKANFDILKDLLYSSGQPYLSLPKREQYLNNLSLKIQAYIEPISLLERVNYSDEPAKESPLHHFLSNVLFNISKSGSNGNGENGDHWVQKADLWSILEHYHSFVLASEHIDSSAIVAYLVNLAKKRVEIDAAAPLPVLLDIERWPNDLAWSDWLRNQAEMGDASIDDGGSQRIFIAYGIGNHTFKNHPKRDSFEEWLNSASPALHFIVICTYTNDIAVLGINSVLVTPTQATIEQLDELFSRYPTRPVSQYVALLARQNSTPLLDYLLTNPLLAIALVSLKVDEDTDMLGMEVAGLFEALIQNLWNIAFQRNHEGPSIADVEIPLMRLAALATEQQKISLDASLLPDSFATTKCVDAGFIHTHENSLCFSMPFIQAYFAAKALITFGLPSKLPGLKFNGKLHRIPQRWDKALVIASHLATNKNVILNQIAQFDPLLALTCIVSGVRVSQALYSEIIEQNLSSLTSLGDFRVNFATILYRSDSSAAKKILIETLRDASWRIRLDAFEAITEMEIPVMPGLAKAVENLAEDTKEPITKALHSLNAETLPTLYYLLRDDDTKVRVNAAWALGELGDKAATPALLYSLQDSDFAVSKQVVISLGLLQDIKSVPYLIRYSRTHRAGLRREISRVLTDFYTKMPEQFTSMIQKMGAADKKAAIQILSGSSNNNLVNFLLDLSADDDVDVRLEAIKELAIYPDERVISRLEAGLGDMAKSKLNKTTVSEIASKILANIQKTNLPEPVAVSEDKASSEAPAAQSQKSSDIVKARLLQVKEDRIREQEANPDSVQLSNDETAEPKSKPLVKTTDDNYVSSVIEQVRERKWEDSSDAAKTLQQYVKNLHGTASLQVINQILEMLNDSDWVIRWTGVETLGWTGNVYVVPHLVQRLSDDNWKIRIAAIRSLAEIGDKSAVAGLTTLLSDKNPVVREAAAEALGTLNGVEALNALEVAATDEEDFVRLAAVESLGKLRQQSARRMLLSALKDKSEHVRWAAANGLANIASPDMVETLVPSLSDTGGPYWEQKRICDMIVDILKQIGTADALKALAAWDKKQA